MSANQASTSKPMQISCAGQCPRRVAYRTLRYPESDPPDQRSRNIMEISNSLEPIMIRNLENNGWEIRHSILHQDEQLNIQLNDPPVRGSPNGICRHPQHTKDLWVTLKCKSMSSQKLQEVRRSGIAEIYPECQAQAACYAQALYEMKLVSHPQRAIFAAMDREGNFAVPERLSWDRSYFVSLSSDLYRTWLSIMQGELPEKPYGTDDPICGSCPYFTLCHGEDFLPVTNGEEPVIVIEDALIEAAERWAQAKQVVDETTDTLAQACNDFARHDLILGNVRAGYIHSHQNAVYDESKLARYLAAEILRKCRLSIPAERTFWVRHQPD